MLLEINETKTFLAERNMTKDRLEELHAAQRFDNEAKNDDVNVFLNGSESKFYNQVQEIRDMINKIQKNVDEVKIKHSAILTATQTNEKIKYELEDLMAEIKKTAIKVREKLKLIEINNDLNKNSNLSRTDLKIKKTQHSTLSRIFVDVMNEYNRMQLDHRDRSKNRIQRQFEITGHIINDDELENMLEQGNLAVFTQGIIMESQQGKQSLADIEARYDDIIKLERSIHEIHSVFIDMAMLVETQGEQIDLIEHHMMQAKDSVYKGGLHLSEAETIFKKYLKKKMVIIICLSFALLILVVMFVCKLAKLM